MEAGAEILDAHGAASVLDWWREAGVDVAIAEEPRNWLAEPRAQSGPAQTASAAPAAAALPLTLSGFHAWLETVDSLPDGSISGQRILPQGDPASGLMVMIDMPESADSAGAPLLSDETGRLFDRMLGAIGRDRASIYFASLCFGRPAGGRIDSTALESLTALAKHHIALAAPKRLLLMGQAVSRAVLGAELVQARGKLHHINHEGAKVEAIASFAPRFLIQNPARKGDSWQDLRMLIGGMDV